MKVLWECFSTQRPNVFSCTKGVFQFTVLCYRNTHSINCTSVTVTAVTAVTLELLHVFLLIPLKSNFLKFLEEVSTGWCVGAIPEGPHTLHRDKMTPPPCKSVLMYCILLKYSILQYNIYPPCALQ